MMRAAILSVASVSMLLSAGGEVAAAIFAGPVTLNNGETFLLDLNNDGLDDFELSVAMSGESGSIRGLSSKNHKRSSFGIVAHLPPLKKGGHEWVRVFDFGDTIGPVDFEHRGSGGPNIYDDEKGRGPFSEIGASGFLGLSVSTKRIILLPPPPRPKPISLLTDKPDVGPKEEESFGTFYGFLEITRGSITIEDVGFEETPGAPDFAGASSAVPEPSSLALFAAAAVGFAVYYLRRKQAA